MRNEEVERVEGVEEFFTSGFNLPPSAFRRRAQDARTYVCNLYQAIRKQIGPIYRDGFSYFLHISIIL